MFRSFGDKRTEDLFHGRNTSQARRIATNIRRTAVRKLDQINAAVALDDLRSPPGNRLEALSGDLKAMHSIRINDQWRIVFAWSDSGAEDVQVIDYHR
ncbi:MAG: type II toxin-antitoxin system RelE/ParE family toxin [Pseudomonadaceae bacterium]|nr:type II toxin-antitoxin system RelE/ParE family toxin [Pseudomonadaceae bacterium]